MAQKRGTNGKRTAKQQVPEEIKEYYQAEKRDRMWVVWLLTGATFFVTVFVVLGIFWGGRWVVNKIRGNDKGGEPQTVRNDDANKKEEASPNSNNPSGSSSTTSSTTNTTNQTSSNNSSTTNSQPTPATTPNTGPSTPELPHTGPSSDD